MRLPKRPGTSFSLLHHSSDSYRGSRRLRAPPPRRAPSSTEAKPTAVQLRGCRRTCCPRRGHSVVAKQSLDAGCRDSQQWSPCSAVWAWAATSPLLTSGSRHPHHHGQRCRLTSRVQPRTSRPPFLAGTIGRSRRRARRRARVRGQSKPARRRPPRPPGLLMIFPRGALQRPRRRRPRRRRALSSSPPRCGRRRTRAAEARQYGGGRRRRS